VLGVVVILAVLFVVGPVAIFFGGAVWSALSGWLLTEDTEHADAADAAVQASSD
jgi:hypothetical protein